MNALANLKLVAAKRSTPQSPAQQRRTKLCKKLHEQMQLATAQAEGRVYAPAKFKTVTDTETGAKRSIETVKKVKQWWWTDGDGKLNLSVRYGAKVLELAKGKNAIEIASAAELVPTLTVCIDPAETAQVRLLMRKPQQVFSCPTPGVVAGGCKSQSSHQ